MPKFTIPKSRSEVEVAPPFDFQPSVYFPANKEMVESVEVGDSTTITIAGKVVSKSQRTQNGKATGEIEMEIKSVELPAVNEFEKLSEDD